MLAFRQTADTTFHLDVHYVCYIMFVQRFDRGVGAFQISIIIIII